VADSVAASRVRRIVVVTGHEHDRVEASLAGLDVDFVHNPDYADGLSTSLRAGICHLMDSEEDPVDGVVVCLGDMPRVSAALIDKLIAAFNPLEGRGICVPTYDGKRGNPVLWPVALFPAMTKVAGDVGARAVIGENEELVCEIAVDDDAVLLDIDTVDALRDFDKAVS
jgi:molybdenum cofactor cytidylyltransferase